MTSIVIPFCLEDGDYVLSFFDTNNNSMIGGNYKLQDLEGNLYVCGGLYNDQQISTFSTEVFNDLIEVTFQLTLDTYPGETTWAIFDVSVSPAVELFSGGPFVDPDDDFAILTYNLCLEPGSYDVLVNDAYGDGITDGGFTVTVGNTEVVNSIVNGTGSSATFTVD
ncbi:hypothetical protein [Winogradskyella sp. UBA3174]|uniref:hypothetical protein n=1 Tax=Winogradskyella sp. UBA3174 TaxID=1947785 RepID=UPI0025E60FF1|nr:hypothetical protein [Winogradskyella sp. UBA3174]|tara:strand:- start:25502 stop:25999 length:498 start_codon:yes stop_codon:yes gene_type:complete